MAPRDHHIGLSTSIIYEGLEMWWAISVTFISHIMKCLMSMEIWKISLKSITLKKWYRLNPGGNLSLPNSLNLYPLFREALWELILKMTAIHKNSLHSLWLSLKTKQTYSTIHNFHITKATHGRNNRQNQKRRKGKKKSRNTASKTFWHIFSAPGPVPNPLTLSPGKWVLSECSTNR